jgi:hypothetical protein
VLDLLDGSAVGSRGGQPEHEVELQAGIFRNGLGARLTGNYQSGTFVRGVPIAGGGASSDLRFSDLATFNLRLFADLGAQRSLVRRVPFFRASRVSLSVDNLLDARPQVRDLAGETPLGFQSNLLDPLGRSIRISFRSCSFDPAPRSFRAKSRNDCSEPGFSTSLEANGFADGLPAHRLDRHLLPRRFLPHRLAVHLEGAVEIGEAPYARDHRAVPESRPT